PAMHRAVQRLHAARAEQGLHHAAWHRPTALHPGRVVEQRRRVTSVHADRPASKQPRGEHITAKLLCAPPDEAVRVGQEGKRAVRNAIVWNIGHAPSFLASPGQPHGLETAISATSREGAASSRTIQTPVATDDGAPLHSTTARSASGSPWPRIADASTTPLQETAVTRTMPSMLAALCLSLAGC